jgi:hypothetical protein
MEENVNGWYIALRWTLFVVVGIPFQVLCYALYPLLLVYYRFYVKPTSGEKLVLPAERWSIDELIGRASNDRLRDEFFLDIQDDHAALCHYGLWFLRPGLAAGGLRALLYPNGGLRRRYPNDGGNPVSGDALSSWAACYAMHGGDKELLRSLAKHYTVNCMGLGAYAHDWKVSNRSSNSGVNYVFDGWKGINQPCLGPQYFTSAALLALAARDLGGWWHVVYFLHWLLMGGWMFSIVPFIGTHLADLYYVQHVTMLNLYTVSRCSRNPVYKWAMRYIAIHCSPGKNVNPLFYALAATALTESEREEALKVCTRIKHLWPQVSPTSQSFFDSGMDNDFYSIVAGAAAMLRGKA